MNRILAKVCMCMCIYISVYVYFVVKSYIAATFVHAVTPRFEGNIMALMKHHLSGLLVVTEMMTFGSSGEYELLVPLTIFPWFLGYC